MDNAPASYVKMLCFKRSIGYFGGEKPDKSLRIEICLIPSDKFIKNCNRNAWKLRIVLEQYQIPFSHLRITQISNKRLHEIVFQFHSFHKETAKTCFIRVMQLYLIPGIG